MFCKHFIFKLMLLAVFALQASGCGTILYPERRNQNAGRVDVGVALLDGFWLLIGIIPGVVAFAVDFSTGAIYIPDSELSSGNRNDWRLVRYNPRTTSRTQLEALISKETGQSFRFSDNRFHMIRVDSEENFGPYVRTQAQLQNS